MKRKALLTGINLLLVIASLSCSDVRLNRVEPAEVSAKSLGEFCISEPTEVLRYMKFLFVIDKSGSNSSTDRGGMKRSTNIENFVKSNFNKKYYRYGMIGFEGDKGARAYIHDGDPSVPTFTEDPEVVFRATVQIRSELDGGSTPYKAALGAVQSAIRHDLDQHPDEFSTYMVFFVSDGQPTDSNNPIELEALVKQLGEINPNIHLSTAYYGNAGSNAIDLLRQMGEAWGRGKFVNFESDREWDFDELVVKPTHEPWQMKSFLVYNLNASYCEDGRVDTDSDADGMCDRDEMKYDGTVVKGITYRFDPRQRFSHGGAFGDYFRWREMRYGEVLPGPDQCQDRSDEDHDLLTKCEEAFIRNDRPSSGVSRNADSKNPDTDRDGILDGIETFVYFTRSLGYALDSFNLLRSNIDGEEQAGLQIAQHRNPLIRDSNETAYDTVLEKTEDLTHDCYRFSQEILPLYPTLKVAEGDTLPGLEHDSGTNMILIYYIQTPQSDPQGDGVLKYSIQGLELDPLKIKVLASGAGLKVRDDVFKQYVVPR